METTLCVDAVEFRQALESALLYTQDEDYSDHPLDHVCLHKIAFGSELKVVGLDGHGFYHQVIKVYPQENGKHSALPVCQTGTFKGVEQLLIPAREAKNFVKQLPNKGNFTAEIIVKDNEIQPNEKFSVMISCNAMHSFCITFETPTNHYKECPNYLQFIAIVEENKMLKIVQQGRRLPIKEYARLAKALPKEAVFSIYWGKGQEQPILVELENTTIILMPTKWVD